MKCETVMVLYLIFVGLLMVVFLVCSMDREKIGIVEKSNGETATNSATEDCFLYTDFWLKLVLSPSFLVAPLLPLMPVCGSQIRPCQ